MKQSMLLVRRGGSVTFWAWMVSIAVHLIVLTVFGVARFSQSRAQAAEQPTPMAKVSQIRKLTRAAPTIPKPKVKKPVKTRLTKGQNRLLPADQIFDTAKPDSQDSAAFTKPSFLAGRFSASDVNLPNGIEFFGSWSNQRKVCYVVDCSGSMQGTFGRVRKKLRESIQNLLPDQYFYIIFFGGDGLFEFRDGRLLRATQNAKLAACDFIDLTRPAGRTNALAALERAVQIRDTYGVSPSVIYFLTDGFELTTGDALRFSQKIADLLKRFAPTTKINTIGFWPQTDDREMLETIARQSGGEFISVTGPDK